MKTYTTEQRQCGWIYADRQFMVEDIAKELCVNQAISVSSMPESLNGFLADDMKTILYGRCETCN